MSVLPSTQSAVGAAHAAIQGYSWPKDSLSSCQPLQAFAIVNMQVQLMTKYLVKGEHQGATEVPDPFHGGEEGFEKVRLILCHATLCS